MARTLHGIHETRIASVAEMREGAIEAGIEVGTGAGTCAGTETGVLAGKGLTPETAISTGTAVPRQSLNFRCVLTLATETPPFQLHANRHSLHNPVRLPRPVSPCPTRA